MTCLDVDTWATQFRKNTWVCFHFCPLISKKLSLKILWEQHKQLEIIMFACLLEVVFPSVLLLKEFRVLPPGCFRDKQANIRRHRQFGLDGWKPWRSSASFLKKTLKKKSPELIFHQFFFRSAASGSHVAALDHVNALYVASLSRIRSLHGRAALPKFEFSKFAITVL